MRRHGRGGDGGPVGTVGGYRAGEPFHQPVDQYPAIDAMPVSCPFVNRPRSLRRKLRRIFTTSIGPCWAASSGFTTRQVNLLSTVKSSAELDDGILIATSTSCARVCTTLTEIAFTTNAS